MRKPMVAGNWKMNLLRAEAIALAQGVRERCDGIAGVETVLCPSSVFLHDVRAVVEGSTIRVGAQTAHWEAKGAFTGDVSIAQIAEAAEYAIMGHSECRQFFGDTDETVNRRVRAALAHGVQPIFCVGELLEQRQSGTTPDVLVRQMRGGLEGVAVGPEFVVAYEPIWAIGTGLAADGETAQTAIALLRETLQDIAGAIAAEVRILYGGSVTADNMAEFISQPDIDGGLVGGASLKIDSFAGIVDAAAASVARRST